MSQITFYTDKQREVEKWINESGFRTELEVPFGRFCADIFIPELNWIVEIDGPAHKYKKKKDKLRDIELIDIHKVEHVLRVRVAIGQEVFKKLFVEEIKRIKGDNPFEEGAERNIEVWKSMKSWLEDLIDTHLTSYIREERSVMHFHPSWAGKCPRLIQLMMSGVIPESEGIGARIQRIFDTGHDMHDRYGRYFEKMGILVGKEIALSYEKDGVIIKGNADYTIKDEFGKIHLLELKSMNNRRFNELWLANTPVPENFLQWNVYSKCLDIPMGELLYENKDDCNIKIFSLRYDEAKFNEVFSTFKAVLEYSKKDLLFPIHDKCDMKYCPAKGFCKEEFKK